MRVLIDPYMFKLSDTKEIKDNVSFFLKVIELSGQSDKKKKLDIAIYKGLLEKIRNREIQPFPISVKEITDLDLKKTVLILNQRFNNSLLCAMEELDIDQCFGEQNFSIIDDETFQEDDEYYDMFNILLIPCYLSDKVISDKILTGVKQHGKSIGDSFQIQCICSVKQYSKKCLFTGIDEFISSEDHALSQLKEKKDKGEINIVEVVPAEMGDHHNHIQADGKKFQTLDELSRNNKRVLKMLQKVGLKKIIFKNFSSTGVGKVGTMNICSVREEETQDIVEVKFNAETKFQIYTDLYFPREIGKLLSQYLGSQNLTYLKIDQLLDRLT